MLSAKAFFLELQFARFLSELAGRAAVGGAAIAAPSAFDVVAASNRGSLCHLEDPSKSTPSDKTVDHTVGIAASTAMFRVGVSFGVQVFITVLNLAVDDAWAEAGDDTGSSVVATSTEPIAPFTTVGAHREVLDITVSSRHHSGLGSGLLSIGHIVRGG